MAHSTRGRSPFPPIVPPASSMDASALPGRGILIHAKINRLPQAQRVPTAGASVAQRLSTSGIILQICSDALVKQPWPQPPLRQPTHRLHLRLAYLVVRRCAGTSPQSRTRNVPLGISLEALNLRSSFHWQTASDYPVN